MNLKPVDRGPGFFRAKWTGYKTMTWRGLSSTATERKMSVWHTACKLLTLTLIGALPGCVVYQFDPSSVEVTEVPPYETHTVPFRVAGDEQPDWLIPESDEVPEVYLARSQLKYGWPNVTTLNTITSIITIGLIPAHDEQPYYDVYELTWQGETLAQSQVHYTLDTYFSLYFPTPLLFLGSLADEQDEHAEAKAYITDLHKDQLLATIDQQRKEFQNLNPTTPEEIAAYLTGPGRSSVYRPAAITRLIDMAPETDALAYHEANSGVPGYLDLLSPAHQAWLIGPENLRGFDLQSRLAQGAEEDELLIEMLNAYPTRESGQLVATAVTWGYYTGMTPEHRSILKTGGLPESLVERMTNEAPLPELLAAAQSGQLRDADGNIRIPTQEELLEQLVRKDNQGRYMSPYTSDDVLAEWVNSAINANIGSTIGTGVGAAAGAYVGEKALEQVPFVGGFLGGAVGAEIGKSVGRETAISASGGWEAIRASSDRSFDNIQSMARYLRSKYGHTGNFTDAMDATRQIYPELADALAQAY